MTERLTAGSTAGARPLPRPDRRLAHRAGPGARPARALAGPGSRGHGPTRSTTSSTPSLRRRRAGLGRLARPAYLQDLGERHVRGPRATMADMATRRSGSPDWTSCASEYAALPRRRARRRASTSCVDRSAQPWSRPGARSAPTPDSGRGAGRTPHRAAPRRRRRSSRSCARGEPAGVVLRSRCSRVADGCAGRRLAGVSGEHARPDHRHRAQRHQHHVGHAPPPRAARPGALPRRQRVQPQGLLRVQVGGAFHKQITAAAGINDFDSRPTAFERAQPSVTDPMRAQARRVPRAREPRARPGRGQGSPHRSGPSRCGATPPSRSGSSISVHLDAASPCRGRRAAERRTTRDPDREANSARYETFNVARWVNSSLVSERETRGTTRAFVRYVDLLTTGGPYWPVWPTTSGCTYDVDVAAGEKPAGRRLHRPRPAPACGHLGRPRCPRPAASRSPTRSGTT